MPAASVSLLPDAQRIEDVLAFWFGTDPAQPLAHSSRWFERSDAFDADVRLRYGALVERVGRGELDVWQSQPRSALAFVIVLDQFPRNLHRDSPRAFAFDARAQACTLAGLERGLDRSLAPVQRWFFLMPLMHAEDLALQDRCVREFSALVDASEGDVQAALRSVLSYAERHRAAVARFGRFPHRNSVLGRPTTPDEAAWLEAHPGGF